MLIMLLMVSPLQAASGRDDYDLDDDGLIEINDLADLNEIRNNMEAPHLYGVDTGCPVDGCTGFELTTDLDFDTNGDGVMDANDDYWNDGAGWQPIGSNNDQFSATFEGNGHEIANLYIDRDTTDYVGLFGGAFNATIQNLALTGDLTSITGGQRVGSLVGSGDNITLIANYVTGSVQGSKQVGGLIGNTSFSSVTACFFSGDVYASDYAGGLAGYSHDYTQYVANFVSGTVSSDNNAAGLVSHSANLTFTANLVISVITGSNTGALVNLDVGYNENNYNDNYWADTTGQTGGYSLDELVCPTAADDHHCALDDGWLFLNWADQVDGDGNAYWDFGSSSQLPGLYLDGTVYRDSDGDGVLDGEDAFPNDATETTDSDSDGVGDNADAFPNDPAETTDTDGDGEGDNAELPSLVIPDDLTVISEGYRTSVDLGTAFSEDADDGQLTPTADDYGPYTTGRHTITWSVTNSEDYTVTDTQVLDVIPLVTVTSSAIVEKGSSIDLTVSLNGPAVSYPVAIVYTVNGSATAGTDHDLASGELQIEAGQTATLTVNAADDGVLEGDENVLISLVSATNAALGATSVHDLTITETNVAPTVEVIMEQGGETVATAYADGGNVTLTAMVVDPNADDTHVYDWSLTDSVLVPSEGYEASTFTFDPTGLNGAFDVAVIVMDDQLAAGVQSTSLRIEAITPTLSAGTDSDNDTLSDADEGVTDSNGNRVADYLDPASDDYLLAVDGEGALMEGESGQRLTLGDTAYGAGLGVSRLSLDELATAMGETDLTPENYEFTGDVFDFEIRGLQSGQSARVVLPLSSALLENAEYLKYVLGEGWVAFVEDDNNGLASAEGALGVCPAPGSSAYSDGLNEGHYCVQLTLEDGGPSDADGEANGIIKDPGLIAVEYVTPPTITVAAYDLDQIEFQVGDGEQVVFGFTLTSDSSDAMVEGLTLQAGGTLDDATVGEVMVYLDSNSDGIADASEAMGSGSYDSDDGSLSLVFDTGYQLPVGDTTFLVTYPF